MRLAFLTLLVLSLLLFGCASETNPEANAPQEQAKLKVEPSQPSNISLEENHSAQAKEEQNQNDSSNSTYDLGLVYVYYDEETYNPNWRTEIGKIVPKIEKTTSEVTSGKVNATIDILGEVKTNVFCWNPAKLSVKSYNPDLSGYVGPPPGSSFSINSSLYSDKMPEFTCSKCAGREVMNSGVLLYEVYLSCGNIPVPDGRDSKREKLLRKEISQSLGVNLDRYDDVIVVFGRFGRILQTEAGYLDYKCSTSSGLIEAYSNIYASENSLIEPSSYLVDCRDYSKRTTGYEAFGNSHYLRVGWHVIVHEILHRFGAVDVYQTGLMFGVDSSREKALQVDPRTDESIMGDDARPSCMENDSMEKDGNICTTEELELVYLDKYNRQVMGIAQ